MVGVAVHDVAHMGPPSLADFGVSDCGPACLVLDFGVGEKLQGPFV